MDEKVVQGVSWTSISYKFSTFYINSRSKWTGRLLFSIIITTSGGDSELYVEYLNAGKFDEYLAQRLFETEFNLSTSENGGWYWSTGTSMATPKVSAVAALLIDKYGKMSPAKLEQLLYKVAIDPVKGKDKAYFGNGFLNAYKALQ